MILIWPPGVYVTFYFCPFLFWFELFHFNVLLFSIQYRYFIVFQIIETFVEFFLFCTILA